MNYSNFHLESAAVLASHFNINGQDVLNFPEKYLGPNYKEVLNLWFYWDSLSDEQWNVYWDRWYELSVENRDKAAEIANKSASEVLDIKYWEYGVDDVIICEIIAAHLYLERGIPFTFLPLFFDL
jgi:hypothetical protein